MRQLLFAQNGKRVLDKEARRIQHNQDLCKQRLDQRLACFLRYAAPNVGFMREKNLLETTHYLDAIVDAPRIPLELCSMRAGHRSAHFGRTSTIEFAENFSRRRVQRGDTRDGEFSVDGHLQRSVRGTEDPYQSFPSSEISFASVFHLDQI